MMRGPSAWSVAVRKPDGEIAEVNRPISSFLLKHRWARLPVVRGVFALGESLAIGFRALAISANYAAQEEGEDGRSRPSSRADSSSSPSASPSASLFCSSRSRRR